jgi:VWFA-related protein
MIAQVARHELRVARRVALSRTRNSQLATIAFLLAAVPLFAQVKETITVERILVDARVTQANGDPMLGLMPDDFRVRVDNKAARVESVTWVPESAKAREDAGIEAALPDVNTSMDVPPPRGRLLVFFYQTDIARENVRVVGQMQINQYIDKLMDMMEEDDRMAVLSFDSHLKFRLDFTDDKHRLAGAMKEAILMNEPAPPPIVPMPSLASHLDRDEMKKAGSTERALIVIGNALRPIPGPKTLIFVGYGMGRFSKDGVRMEWNYPIARYALESARVSVFTLDFTQADSHSLEAGLGKISADTGGSYAKTFRFPTIAIDHLQRTLAGHYELEVRKPSGLKKGAHLIEVDVAKRGAEVLARRTYVDRD